MSIELRCTELNTKVKSVVSVHVALFLSHLGIKKFSPCKLFPETMRLIRTLHVSCFTLDRNTDFPE